MTPLTQVLEGIYAAKGVPRQDQRFLAARAVGHAMQGQPQEDVCTSCSPQYRYEEVLAAAGQAMGLEGKPSVQMVKAALRAYGVLGHQLASRLGKLSKCRNSASHVDTTLLCDVVKTLSEQNSSSGDTFEQEESVSMHDVIDGIIDAGRAGVEQDPQVADGSLDATTVLPAVLPTPSVESTSSSSPATLSGKGAGCNRKAPRWCAAQVCDPAVLAGPPTKPVSWKVGVDIVKYVPLGRGILTFIYSLGIVVVGVDIVPLGSGILMFIFLVVVEAVACIGSVWHGLDRQFADRALEWLHLRPLLTRAASRSCVL